MPATAAPGMQGLRRHCGRRVTDRVRHIPAGGKAIGMRAELLPQALRLVGCWADPRLLAAPVRNWEWGMMPEEGRRAGKAEVLQRSVQTALCFSPPAQGAVTRGTGYVLRDFSALQRLQAWLWTNVYLAAQGMEGFQVLLRPRVSDVKAALQGTPGCWEGGAGRTTLPYRAHTGEPGLRAQSGKWHRHRAILRAIPDHLPKSLRMSQRLTGCRQMGNSVFRVRGTAEM